MSNKVYSINEIKRIVSPIAEEYGVARVFLFCSYARGKATEDSDLDFRIDKGKLQGLTQLGGMYSDLDEKFDLWRLVLGMLIYLLKSGGTA